MNMMKHWIRAWVLFAGCSGLLAAHALTPQLAMEMAVGESDNRIQAIGKALEAPDANTAALLQAIQAILHLPNGSLEDGLHRGILLGCELLVEQQQHIGSGTLRQHLH
ncbi:MAG: hypothetical protein EBV21_08745, partial [Betaproteobacteria bacterium]|nr:hypothetical protein [Betaproteobacteria bacterium]